MLIRMVYVSAKRVWTKLNDLALNIDTEPDVPLRKLLEAGRPYLRGEFSEKAKYQDNVWYESPDYWCIRKVAGIIKPRRGGREVFYDLGSGKGRILCVMARQPFAKVVGVELFEDLCAAARQNALRLRGHKAPIEIVCADAARADLSQGTVFFMFNPFGADTLREVLANLERSLREHPRRIVIVYYHDVHAHLLQSCPWLENFHAFQTATRRRVSFWRNRNVPAWFFLHGEAAGSPAAANRAAAANDLA